MVQTQNVKPKNVERKCIAYKSRVGRRCGEARFFTRLLRRGPWNRLALSARTGGECRAPEFSTRINSLSDYFLCRKGNSTWRSVFTTPSSSAIEQTDRWLIFPGEQRNFLGMA